MTLLHQAQPFSPAGLLARKAIAWATLLGAMGCALFAVTVDGRAEQMFTVAVAVLLAFFFIVQRMNLSPAAEEVLSAELLGVCRDPQEARMFLAEASRQGRGLTCAEVRMLVAQPSEHWADLKL